MRPQHITAENGPYILIESGYRGASMRPQHITAENVGEERRLGGGTGQLQ